MEMELKKLDRSFYLDNPVVQEALDFDNYSCSWMHNSQGKVRGHGIVSVTVNDLTFAIPARSNIRHKAAFILEVNRSDSRIKGMGLDLSKALLIRDPNHISHENFALRTKEAGKRLVGKEHHIAKLMTDYVEKYVRAFKANNQHILGSAEYRFTTLINYHTEIGIHLP